MRCENGTGTSALCYGYHCLFLSTSLEALRDALYKYSTTTTTTTHYKLSRLE